MLADHLAYLGYDLSAVTGLVRREVLLLDTVLALGRPSISGILLLVDLDDLRLLNSRV